MDKNLSMENRLSFNRPIAESTFRASIASPLSFQWGRKNLNNSTMNRSTAKSPVREKTGLSKIDARIYADVQSRGLTSRIVKYHETGTRLNRSISMNNLSNECRQFPATRATKPKLPYKASKQNVSMTHIAPPDKSAFYGNTLSGLLRSSSVISLQHNDDDISSENRPIIHPPVTEKELQPTRSVLEVLKEISRKRINNEDADDGDTSKKYCNRIDGVDGINGSMQQDYRSIQIPQTYKRQRESTTECFNAAANRIDQQAHLTKAPAPNQQQEASSPEQKPKRRHCNYNNDITSSLSSSQKSTNKRKLLEHEGEKQQEKQLRFQSEIRLPELSTALSYAAAKVPITPLPNTPQSTLNHSISSSNDIPLIAPVQKSISAPVAITEKSTSKAKSNVEKPKLTLFNKNYESNCEEPSDDTESAVDADADDNSYAGIPFVKPKKSATTIGGSSASHLLMERTQKSKLALMLSGLRGELYLGDADDNKPEEKTTQKATDNVSELQKTNATTTDTKQTTAATTVSSTTPTTSTTISTTNTFGQSTLTTNLTSTTVKTNASVVDAPTSTATSTTPPTSTKISSPLTGIKLTPQTTSIATTSTTAPSVSVAPTFSFGLGTAMKPPATTGNSVVSSTDNTDKINSTATNANTAFTFGTTTAKTSTTVTTTQPTLPTFGQATQTAQNLSTFAIKPSTSISAPITTTTTIATSAPGFSFGGNATPAAIASSTGGAKAQPNAAPATAKAPLFSFGNSASQAAPIVTNATSSVAIPSGESVKTTTTAATPFSFGANKTSGGFSFGATANVTTNAPTATEAPKMFSFTTPTKTSTAAGGFSFGGTTSENKPNTSNMFGSATITPIKFGASNTAGTTSTTTRTEPQQQQHAAPTQPAANNVFGFASKPADAAAAPSTFGVLAESKQSKPFSFGAAATTEAPKSANIFTLPSNASNKPLSFGGSTAQTASSATTNNAFSLANNSNNNTNNNNNLFNFGSGGSNTNANASINAATPADATKPSSTFSFGNNAQSKPFSFGGAAAEAPKPPAFSFGGAANNSISTTTASTKAAASSTFNFSASNQNNTFSFGGVGNKPNTTEPPKMTNSVPAIASPNNNSTNAFAFGGAALTQSSAFGAAPNTAAAGAGGGAGQGNIFSFSGGNNNGASTATATIASAKPGNPTFNTFSGSGQGNTFAFGSGSNTTASSTTTPAAKSLTFGAAGSGSAQANAFVFGGASNNNANSAAPATATGNLFALPNSNANNNPQQPSPFGGNANTTGTTNTNVNIFAAPPSSDRPIRRATRRLTKI